MRKALFMYDIAFLAGVVVINLAILSFLVLR